MEHQLKIAIADDHTLIRQALKKLLDSYGDLTTVLHVSGGQQLIDGIAALPSPPDVCLLDINMPGLTGYETAVLLHERWPDMKILAVSMHDTEFSVIKMLRNGAHGYLLKNAEPEELHRAIHMVHEKGCYHSELLSSRVLGQLQHDAQEIMTVINITPAELKYLKWLTSELSIKEIAAKMAMKTRTLEKYSENLSKKLNIKSRIGLAMFAMRIGVVPFCENQH